MSPHQVELARAVEALGAGEIMLNCIDNDGVGKVGTGGHPCVVGGEDHVRDAVRVCAQAYNSAVSLHSTRATCS